MAHIYCALRRWFAALFLVLAVVPSHASFPYPYEAGKEWRTADVPSEWFTTRSGACSRFAVYRNSTFPAYGPFSVQSVTDALCTVLGNNPAYEFDSAMGSRTPASLCPANSTDNGTSCTCTSGFVQSGSTCVPPSCPAAGSSVGDGYGRVTLTAAQKAGLSSNGGYHYATDPFENNCVTKLSLDVCTTGDNGATWQCVGKETWTGESYSGTPGNGAGGDSPSDQTPGAPPSGQENQPTVCPTGQCPGTVNGLTVCRPCSGISTKTPTSEEKLNSDGTSQKKDTVKNTTCTGTTCTTQSTTTTTDKDSSGAVTGTSTVTTSTSQSKGDYCKENPNEPQCDDTGSWGGSCEAGFTCKGDAATCALAREVHQRNCELNAETTESGLYDAAKDATGNQTGDNPNNSTFNVGPGSFNTSDAIGGAQCVQDLSVTVWETQLTLPLSEICVPLAYIANVLVMVSFLLAGRIVLRG